MDQEQLLSLKVVHSPKEGPKPMPGAHGEVFFLETCQRKLQVSLSGRNLNVGHSCQLYHSKEAYRFLLETLCGMKSRILGENEIVAQFKTAYQEFMEGPYRDTRLLKVFETLFKDAKKVRREYLNRIGQQSYAGIAKRILAEAKAESDDPVLIIGSGQLSEDLIKVLKRRNDLVITARNQKVVETLARENQLSTWNWEHKHSWHQFRFIINTIGVEGFQLLDSDFFKKWDSHHFETKVFLDLGKPSSVAAPFGKEKGFFSIEDVFKRGLILDQQKQKSLQEARNMITELVQKKERNQLRRSKEKEFIFEEAISSRHP